MNTGNDAAVRARWQVVYVKDGRIHRIGTGDDFGEALRLYGLALLSGTRSNVTLRSTNMAFPLPEKYRPRDVVFDKPRRTRDGRTVSAVHLVPMRKLNRQGIWWCPFCVKLRRFVFEKGWTTQEGMWMAEPRMRCPLCSVDHNSFAVRQANPLATQMFYNRAAYDPTAPPKRVRRRRPKPKPEED